MELIAEETGGVDDLVAVVSRDLSMPYSFLRIAEIYSDAGRGEEALEWAERGMEAFPERPDSRLSSFLAEAYRGRESHAEAAGLMWDSFTDHPGLRTYRDLKPYAERAGSWPETRDRALAWLRDGVAAGGPEAPLAGRGRLPDRGASELVRIHLWEDDVESALREARASGCPQGDWLTLAERLEGTQPEEAIPIYREQVEPTIDGRTKKSYSEAVRLLAKVRDLMVAAGGSHEFAAYLDEIRTAHKRKRNLIKLLDAFEAGSRAESTPGRCIRSRLKPLRSFMGVGHWTGFSRRSTHHVACGLMSSRSVGEATRPSLGRRA